MKRVLFDHSALAPLARFLKAFDIRLADEIRWARLRNGDLLTQAEQAGFDVLLSGDKSMKTEQNMNDRKIALLYMSDNHWPIVKDHVPAIEQEIEQARPGDVKTIFCGTFVPRRFCNQLAP